MCDSIFHVVDPIFGLTLYPVIAYDAVIGVCNFIRFMNRLKTAKKGAVSFKLSAGVIAFCAAAGSLYELFRKPSDTYSLAILGAVLLLYTYPLVDYMLKKNRSRWDNFFRFPFALGVALAGSYCVFVVYCSGEYHCTFN